LSALPTIWDRIAAAGLDGRYYFSDIPFPRPLGEGSTLVWPRDVSEQFFVDAAAGQLPHVSFVEPRFLGEQAGVSNVTNPFADIRNGQAL
jgi:phospholipase C